LMIGNRSSSTPSSSQGCIEADRIVTCHPSTPGEHSVARDKIA
jgi:hypothetical protein